MNLPASNETHNATSLITETIRIALAGVGGAGLFVAILGASYIFSAASQLHYVHILEYFDIDLRSAGVVGGFLGAVLEFYRHFQTKK